MRIRKRVRLGRQVALGIALMAAVALFFAWGHSAGTQVAAQEPSPGLDFSISVEGIAGCDTVDGDTKCVVPIGSTFTVDVNLNSLPTYGGSYLGGSYIGFDVYYTYTGVTSEDNATAAWPDCAFPATFFAPGEVAFGCVRNVGAGPSTYTGPIVTNDFQCTSDETTGHTITLVHGARESTSLLQAVGQAHAEGEGVTETLTIHCQDVPPTPTNSPVPEETATPEPGAAVILPTTGGGIGAGADGGASAALWAITAALLTAAAAGLAVFGWRYARSRR